MIKRFFTILVLLVCILASAVYFVLMTPYFTPRLAHWLLARNYPQLRIGSVSLDGQEYDFPGRLTFKGLKGVAQAEDQVYTLEIESLDTEGLLTAWRSRNQLNLNVQGARLQSEEFFFEGLAGDLSVITDKGKISSLTGEIKCATARADLYEFQNIRFVLQDGEEQVALENFTAESYGALFMGEILLEYPPSLSYSIQMEFKGLEVARLRALNPELPLQIEGVFAGTVNVKGRGIDLEKLDLNVHVVEKGKIRASLLNFVTQYIPPSQQREYLEKMVASGGKVSMEEASVDLESVSSDKLTALIKLFSRELNLKQNFVIDINSDGKITSLLDYLDKLSF